MQNRGFVHVIQRHHGIVENKPSACSEPVDDANTVIYFNVKITSGLERCVHIDIKITMPSNRCTMNREIKIAEQVGKPAESVFLDWL